MSASPTTQSLSILTAERVLAMLDGRTDPKQRLLLAKELEDVANVLQHEAASDARANGETWQSIGGWLGISKQAAQQRF